MAIFEYKVVPAPARGEKAKGVKTPEERFAFRLEHLMNDMARDGWEFQRAETLPSEERGGLAQTVTNWRSVLVFRRAMSTQEDSAAVQEPALLAPPKEDARPDDTAQPESQPEPEANPMVASDGADSGGTQPDIAPDAPVAVSESPKPGSDEPSLERFMRLRAKRGNDT